jgi:biopolymer transport protein ExbD
MKKFDQVNVVPFIDIMLVLLAIVLMTATFIAQEGLELDLPTAESSEKLVDQETVKIGIDRDENLSLAGERVSIDELRDRLKVMSQRRPIQLSIDRAVSFGRFVSVIDLLKANHLENMSIVTLPES